MPQNVDVDTGKTILRIDSPEVIRAFTPEEIEMIKQGGLAFEIDDATYHAPRGWRYSGPGVRWGRNWVHTDVEGRFILKACGELTGDLDMTPTREEISRSCLKPEELRISRSELPISSLVSSEMNLRRGYCKSISFYTARIFEEDDAWSIHCYREPVKGMHNNS